MSRPRKTNRSIDVHLRLPEDLYARLQLILWSELEGRIPLGRLSEFFDRAARAYLEQTTKEQENVG